MFLSTVSYLGYGQLSSFRKKIQFKVRLSVIRGRGEGHSCLRFQPISSNPTIDRRTTPQPLSFLDKSKPNINCAARYRTCFLSTRRICGQNDSIAKFQPNRENVSSSSVVEGKILIMFPRICSIVISLHSRSHGVQRFNLFKMFFKLEGSFEFPDPDPRVTKEICTTRD